MYCGHLPEQHGRHFVPELSCWLVQDRIRRRFLHLVLGWHLLRLELGFVHPMCGGYVPKRKRDDGVRDLRRRQLGIDHRLVLVLSVHSRKVLHRRQRRLLELRFRHVLCFQQRDSLH